jgi:protein-S-isoprenylcysteine O-methyltransferase Ste14
MIVLQVCLFAGFIWSAKKFFKIDPAQKDIRQKVIQLLGLIQIVNAFVYSFWFPTHALYQQLLAVLFYVLSIFYFYWTLSTVRKTTLRFAFSNSQPQAIIQEGPYRHLRHPFYFSYTCAWIATAFATNYSLIACLAGIVLVSLYLQAVAHEESEFAQTLHDSYGDYQARTSRIIPFIY